MGIKDFSKGRETFNIPLSELFIPKGFHRVDSWGDLDELAKDIVAHGQHEPITVRNEFKDEDKGFYIIAGERRYKAILRANEKFSAKIETMLAFKAPKDLDTKDEGAVIAFQFSENKHKEFSQLESGLGFKKLMEKGWTVSRIADMTSHSQAWVRQCIELANSDPVIQRKVRDGALKPTTARKLNKAPKKVKETILLESDLKPEEKITGKDVEDATAEDKPKEFVLKDLLEWLKERGFQTFSQAKKEGTVYSNNIEIKIDQKEPAFIGVLVK